MNMDWLFFDCRLYTGIEYCYNKGALKRSVWKAGEVMAANAEVIESLARKLERARILNDLKECQTLEEYQELTKKYESLCNDDKKGE